MRKLALSLLAFLLVSSGCGIVSKKPDPKIVEKIKSTNEETFRKFIYAKYPVENIKLEFAKKSEIRPPNQKGNLPDSKLEEWSPKQLEYKGKLVKKWIIKAEKSKSLLDLLFVLI